MHPPPLVTIEDPGWSPGPPGTHSAGEFQVEAVASIITRWDVESPSLRLDAFEDGLCVPLLRGAWRAQLFVQGEDIPAALQRELSEVRDRNDAAYLESVFAVTFRRTWLVLSHESVALHGPPEPAVGTPTLGQLSLVRDQSEGSPVDAVEHLPLVVRSGAESHALQRIGRLEAWTHRIAFVVGDELRPEMANAFDRCVNDSLSAWPWGLVFRCGRPAPIPVFAAGSPTARTVLALPALTG